LDRRRDVLLAVLLLAAAFIAYLPALHGGLILDDDLHITRPELQSLGGLGRIWFDVGATQQYYPVLHTAFWIEHRLWGGAVEGYHLVNVLWHACAACLVVPVMRRLRLRGAWLAAFIFALHPVCVESVAWIAEQKNTLSTFLALGAALAYLRFDDERHRPHFWMALGLFALALLSKTAVVTLPFALLILVWWRRSRLEWRRDVQPLLLWSVLGGAVGLITLAVESRLLAGIHADFTLTPFWFYLGKLGWPADLTFFYPRWVVDPAEGWQFLYPLAGALLAAVLLLLARRRRGPLAAFLCFAAMLAPVLGFLKVEWFVFSYVADHLQYLASLCLIIPLAAALAGGSDRLPAVWRRLAPAAACALLAALGALTWRQCGRYRDPVTFYRAAMELNPGSAVAHNHLGAALAVLPGRMPEAIAQFEIGLRLNPTFAEIHENLGTALMADPARHGEAVEHFEAARRLRPDRITAHVKLAFALAGIPGRLPEAIAEYQAAVQIDPKDPSLHDALGLALMQDPRRLAEAQAEFETALRINSGLADAHYHLGNLLIQDPARTAEALGHYAEALRLRPDFADAHNNLGLALLNIPGRLPEAMAHFEAALRARPDFAQAENNLGTALATAGRLSDAAVHFEAALRLDPGLAQARDNLNQARQFLAQPRAAP
jgi:tetratricopeptide (TPR) repeat protein